MQSPVQFLGKENVHQLGFAVGVLGAVASGQRQVVKVERARSPVEQARGRDDRGFRRNERLQQEIGQEEGRQVVHLNGQFVPVDGEQTATHQTAGIVRQYVNARQVRLKSFGQFPYLIEVGEVLWQHTRKTGTHNRYFATASELVGTLSRVFGEMQHHPESIRSYLLPFC